MTTYVINPITNELESAQPRQTVGDKFKLQTFVRDRFALGTPRRGLVTEPGGYAGKPGSIAVQVLEPSKEIRNFLRKTYPNINFNFKNYPLYGIGTDSNEYSKVRERVTRKFRPEIYEGVKKEKRIAGAEASFGKDGLNVDQRAQLNGVKAGILYQRAINNIVKDKGRRLNNAEKNELRFTLQNNKKFMKLIKDAGFDNVNDFINSGYAKTKENFIKIKGINEGKKLESSQILGEYKTDNTPRGKKLKQSIIARKKVLNDWLNKNIKDKKQIKQIKTTGDFIETRNLRDQPTNQVRKNIQARYDRFLDAGFSSEKVAKLWDAKPGSSKEFHRPTLINKSLGIGDNSTLRFNRSHFFPIMGAGELKNKNLLAPNTFYSDRFTYRPAYINQLQKFFYDQPVTNDINKFLRGSITKQELDKLLATRAKNFTDTFDIDVDQLKLNKNGKFEFVNKDRSSVTGGTFANRIPLIKNAIQELKNTINIQGAGLLDAREIEIAKLKFPDVNVDIVASKFFNPEIPQETYELLKQKPGLNKRIMQARNQDIKSGAATKSTNKSFLFKSFMDKASPFAKKIPGSSIALAPIDFFLMTAGGAPMNEALLSAGSYFLKDPAIGKAVNIPLALLAQQREYKETGEFKPIFNMQAGEDKLRDLIDKVKEKFGDDAPIGTADDVQEPESAERRKMFEEANERLGNIDEMEISDIDNPFMAAMGGRVGFQDGTPPVIPGNEIDYSELQVMMDNPNEYNTFPKGTFAEELDKAVYGTNEERNLLQKFYSMFLDPRVYPYYAQKTVSGIANIPELAFRFPAALTYLYGQSNLALATGDLDRISGKTLMEALEILDPKYTRGIKNTKFGDVVGISDKSMNEQDKTEGQKFVGDIFELGAEAVGPATPVFLFKMFPKLPKQIKDLVGTASAAEKVNKEIEKNMAVDQTRRDLILTIGAGGAVGLLKFLGLDKFIKAPKATKAVTSAVEASGTPQYFFDFVDLIKRKGKDVSDRQAVVERQKVIEYKDYTLTDTDGYITVRKTDEDMGRDEMMEYRPPEGVVDEATGKSTEVPAQYEEVTAKPDANDPGNFDTDQGFDSIDQVLEELAKDGKKYTVKELEEMGINTFVGDEIFPSKVEKAEGGIIAGVKSGPAPKSGPTPHGLPYLAKNVTPIKERK